MRSTTTEVGAWLQKAKARLAGHERPGLEAQVLLSNLTGISQAGLLAHPEKTVDPGLVAQLDQLLERLAAGEPLPYLIGHWQFYGLDFEVTPDVLIPRPETELLVDQAMEWLNRHPRRHNMADVGTGSGCIAASLLVHKPGLRVLAVDRSYRALRVAERNFRRLGVRERVRLACGDLLSLTRGQFSLVTANLPYIPTPVLTGLEVARHEPYLALDGGPGGLELITRLLADADRWLAAESLLLLEIEAGHADTAPRVVRHYFPQADITLLHDLNGKARVVRVEFLRR